MRRALAALAAAAALGCHAQDPRWYLNVDNDILFKTDRWYSSGVRIARVAGHGGQLSEWGVLHEVYTPEARFFQPGAIDRAPTARLLAYHARHAATPHARQTWEVQLGVRGRGAQGERITDAVHHIVSAPDVNWDRERASRLDGRVALARSHAAGPVTAHYGAVLGSEMVFAHAGAHVDLGPVRTMVLPLRYVASPPFAVDGERSGWSGFAGMGFRVVGLDRTLRTAYEEGGEEPRRHPVIGRFVVGLGLHHRWGTVTLAAVQESREFATQRRLQRFGSLALHVPF